MSTRHSTDFRTFGSMSEIIHAHSGHWFDRDTLRFFGSRIPDAYSTPIGGRYFITSEKRPNSDDPRCYTIREALSNGSIQTVGEFQGYTSKRAAERAARELPTTYSASLMETLTSGLHNRTGWIKTSKQLAKYTGAPLADAQATIKARARIRRNVNAREARS